MVDKFSQFAAAFPESVAELASSHLLRADGQEDLCFALWNPSEGRNRFTALISEIILPEQGDRDVHGNVSFSPEYFARVISIAIKKRSGLALMHSHQWPGWQALSRDDFNAEAGHAGAVAAATDLPFLGLTVGSDDAWSARFWRRIRPRQYEPAWCETVRVAGRRLKMTYYPALWPEYEPGEELDRSVGVWGLKAQAVISRLHYGIIGLGSVGSIVAETLARMGAERLSLIDYDVIERINLDRILGATQRDIGRTKVDIAAENALRSATARRLRVDRYDASIVEESGYRAALNCDVLFSCVDRPWPRRVLNHIAYAHMIPVVDGGILVRVKGAALIGADWNVHTVGPGRRCLECLKAFDPSVVSMERDGLLDDPSYLEQLDPDHVLLRHENVFPFSLNVASLEVLQMTQLVTGSIPNVGNQNYHYVTGSLDRIDDKGCDLSCLYPPLIASGDTLCSTFIGLDHGAAKHKRKTCAS
jgi:molybdopterin/thiamine biosynthesis adenylyltransferase